MPHFTLRSPARRWALHLAVSTALLLSVSVVARAESDTPPLAMPAGTGVLLPDAVAAPVPLVAGSSVVVAIPLLAESSGDVEDYSGYSWRYYFSMTRAVSRSTLVTPLKPPLFLFTVPLDIVFLPFAAIGGFF